jgi:hypothetical protein
MPLCLCAVLAFCGAASAQTAAPLSHPNAKEAQKLDEASCSDGFSFAVMADTHFGHPMFDVIRDAAASMKPDFAVSVGDTTNNGTDDEYAVYLDKINSTGIPWFTVPGNHEYRTPEGHTGTEGQVRFKRIFGKQDFAFTHCGWKFILIDIVAMDTLLPGQFSWLKKQLEGFDGKAAVFMHYPPGVIPKWQGGYWTANGKEFLATLEEHRTPYFFSGHIHVYDRIKLGPTNYIITGGGGAGTDSDLKKEDFNSPSGGAFNHFIYVRVNGDKATDFVVMPGEQ